MRCIGIIGAMSDEVAGLKALMQDTQIIRKASMEFYSGILEGKKVVVVQSGIGKVNAAVCTQILIDDFQAEVVFLAFLRIIHFIESRGYICIRHCTTN